MKHIILSILCLTFIHALSGQDERENFRLAFYNLENLFDTTDDPAIRDEEYTPDGMRYWNTFKYQQKIHRMAKAILSIGGWEAPEIVGVSEVENNEALDDLISSPVLSGYNYNIVHYESPDRRGIDVAMLYRKDAFTPLYTESIPVKMPDDTSFTTRDILYVKGLSQRDTLHIFFCHWPSRYGGQQKSEPKRIRAALTLRAKVDSVFAAEKDPYIIIAGDFNDEWNNISLLEYLGARATLQTGESDEQLVNLMAGMNPNKGSHRYKGEWAYLDQIIVSGALLNERGLDLKDHKAHVHEEDFLLEKDDRYPGLKPFRTFIGMRYNGGFSDHLPVYVDLRE